MTKCVNNFHSSFISDMSCHYLLRKLGLTGSCVSMTPEMGKDLPMSNNLPPDIKVVMKK